MPIVSIAFFLSIFYLNYYFLLPKIWKGKGWAIYGGVSTLLFILLLFSQIKLRQLLLPAPLIFSDYSPIFRRIGFAILALIQLIMWVVSIGFWLQKEWKKAEERLRESEHKRTLVELEQLKKQINPHFLFNTLNSIYALTLLKDEYAPEAVLKLSKLMSYVLKDANSDFVALEKDLAHIAHFIVLNRLRLTDKSPLHFESIVAPKGYEIAPLLLLSFIENAFKYGISNVEDAPIFIRLTMKQNQLFLHCRNKIIPSASKEQTGIGINNARQRLNLIYPNRHTLNIQNDGVHFVVNLSIDLEMVRHKPIETAHYDLLDVR